MKAGTGIWRNVLRGVALLMAILLCATGCAAGGGDDKPTGNEGNGGNGGDTRPMIALTFDDGPHNSRTQKIVDELNKYGYHATFFVVGNRVDGSAYNGGAALQYAVDAGNEIGIHGYTHEVYYNKCTDAEFEDELTRTREAIEQRVPGYQVKLMRPIGGAITAERVEACPYSVINWDIDSEDWRYKARGESDELAAGNVDTIVENVMSQVHEGGIILMHDLYENTYEATVIILQRLNEQGYRVVTVSELLGEDMKPGQKYSRAPVAAAPGDKAAE